LLNHNTADPTTATTEKEVEEVGATDGEAKGETRGEQRHSVHKVNNLPTVEAREFADIKDPIEPTNDADTWTHM
jgi:hypothetical protein